MTNLFDKAKTSTKKSISNQEIVKIKGFEKTLKDLISIDKKIAKLQAQWSVLDSEIRETAKEKMISLYEKKKFFPGTLLIQSGEMEYQFITSDAYRMIDKDRAEELIEKYGKNLINKTTIFSFNSQILMKYQGIISKLIEKSKDISDDDKENLIESTIKFAIAKGTIKNLKNKEFSENDLEEMIEEIKPIFSIKAMKKSV